MKTVGVFFGSRSPEHDVSIITGEFIMSGLRKIGIPAVPVYIGKDGAWNIGRELGSLAFFRDPARGLAPRRLRRYALDLERSRGKMVLRPAGFFGALRAPITIDTAFPALHGSYGEDGTIQGLFEMLDVPYVGCDVASSAIAMDKVTTKSLYRAHGIPTVPFVHFTKQEWEADRKNLLATLNKQLKVPLFVKPARLGSSIGIAKVKNEKELMLAIEAALHYDPKVLVEEGVENLMDATVAVLGNDDPRPSLIQESLFEKDLFSYEDKYLKEGGAQTGNAQKSIVIPASLDAKTAEAIRVTAVRVFKLFGCSGTARVDFLYDRKKKKFYANEVNTLPGTLYHHLWKASRVEFPDLLRELLRLAEERHAAKREITYAFSSDILKYANSAKLKTGKLQ